MSTTTAMQQVAQEAESRDTPTLPSFDPKAYQEALRRTHPSTFARTAATYASGPALGPLRSPNLIDCILCDHTHTLTMFSHFFRAAESNAVNIMGMVLGALALDLRLHSQAEMEVLYPVLSRLGPEGAALAQRSLAEHSMVERSIAEMLKLRNQPGDALLQIVKQAQTEFMTHQGEEEALILPRIVAACSEEELSTLALTFKSVKQTASLMPQAVQGNPSASETSGKAEISRKEEVAVDASGSVGGGVVGSEGIDKTEP